MKIQFGLILFLLLVSCESTKKVYWCGDHPCINKKEKEAYFKKTMIVEVRNIKNSKKNISEMQKILDQAKINEKNRIKKEKELLKSTKISERAKIKNEKKLEKLIKKEEKKRIKEERRIAKRKAKEEEKNKNIKLEKKNVKKIVKLASPEANTSIESGKFSEIVSKIQKRNNLKSYPDINNIPD